MALFRKLWTLVPLALATPLTGMLSAEALKPLFGRFKGDALAYPSGHTTVMVVALGMLILAAGARRWLIWAAIAFATLGILGQAVTYHYFTDAVGAVLLGTSIVLSGRGLLAVGTPTRPGNHVATAVVSTCAPRRVRVRPDSARKARRLSGG